MALMSDCTSVIWMGIPGQDAAEVAEGISPGGVALFARNLHPDPSSGPRRCHALIQALQDRWGTATPLAVAIDQEGGPVSRLKAWVGETPSFRDIWCRSGAAGAETWGRLWGEGLRLLGFNVNFAPLADLYDGIPGTGLGERRASAAPAEAAEAAGAFLRGLESQGVKGCLKHFPGLGGTRVDSHQAMPELMDPGVVACGLEPFQRLARPGLLIMVAHVRTPWSGGLPASLHSKHVAGNPWGVQGAWITDDLEMGGCADWPWPERVRLAMEAGHQALLVCHSQEAIDQAVAALRAVPPELTAAAVQAGQAYRRTLALPSRSPFDQAAWEAWVLRVRQEALSPP
jgi:beta-N-acetylhexosaminidase